MPKLSIIVLSKNNGRTIGFTLASIVKSKVPRGYEKEIIVCDAKSTDLTTKILEKFQKWIRVIYDEGRGIGIARNISVKASTGDIICFVDADTIVSRDHFEKIIKTFAKGFDIVDVHGIPPLKVLMSWTKIGKMEGYVWLYGRAYRDERMLMNRKFAGGSFMSFKREIFERVKGFWSYPPFGADDMDFSFRASKRGFKIGVTHIYGSYSIPRQTLLDLFHEQYNWGKGFAYLVAKYRNDIEFLKAYKFKIIFLRYPVIYFFLRLLFSPLGAFKLSLRARKISLIYYWAIRRFFFFTGFITALKAALKFYGKSGS